jgi:hypothetical protein
MPGQKTGNILPGRCDETAAAVRSAKRAIQPALRGHSHNPSIHATGMPPASANGAVAVTAPEEMRKTLKRLGGRIQTW